MSSTLRRLVARDDKGEIDPLMVKLLIVLLVLVILAAVVVGALLFLRHFRRKQKLVDSEAAGSSLHQRSVSANSRRLTISTNRPDSIFVVQEKQNLIKRSSSPPESPIPEIRITFPDETDDHGKRQSGRVVVVRVGDHSVGLEPVKGNAEPLPPYRQSDSERYQSLDLDRMGGLKEGVSEKRWA